MKKRLIISALLSSVFLSNAHAEWISLEYKGFYGHLKAQHDAEVKDARLAFFLANEKGEACKVHRGEVVSAVHQQPLLVLQSNEFQMAFDSNLKKANARVSLDVDDAPNCMMSIRMLADNLGTELTGERAQHYLDEFNALMDEQAGFFGKYFMPDAKGLSVVFNQAASATTADGRTLTTDEKHRIRLSAADFAQGPFQFSENPRIVTPWFAN